MKKIVAISTLIFALVFFTSCKESKPKTIVKPAERELPNIVFILSDDQAWTDYGFMGHKHIETPNIDKLANESLTFTRGYVPTSLCSPSLASIITGVYPRNHLVLGNDRVLPGDDKNGKPAWQSPWRDENYKSVIENFKKLNTLPKMLKEKGYLSFQTGKWWIGNHKNGGFDYGMTHGDAERGGRHGDYGLEIGRKGMDTLYSYIDLALKKKKPFFMWYAPFLPHSPHNPPDSLIQKYLPKAPSEYVARYWAMCEWFDQTCGDLMDYIDKKGQTENTLFVYVCDNGWVQNENDGKYNPISKRSPYDYGLRTPIMYKWKGKIASKRDTISLTSSLDMVPTVLGLLAMEQPKNLDGVDVLNEAAFKSRQTIFGEIYAHDFDTVENSLFYRMAITEPYKLILPDEVNKPNEKIQLYDIYKDPYEKINLAKEHPEIVVNLKNKIQKSWNTTTN
ncbi:sulfatase [Aggregatimonas sangjinii]|uniref:Sulfatase n=1 Tax=Aggregatimonas sangjinii TaxID=2583587 RepID=A0A5B7SLQ8_9FLAO|nr:sulfatase-like hydrolase/transferase [Aggregatimonas sangjinii]QCW99544.1 sulfatase [Aggregatimonas sangjinii]